MALKILVFEPIVLFLSLFNGGYIWETRRKRSWILVNRRSDSGFIYGLGFLFLESVTKVFVINYGLSFTGGDLTFLGLGVGVVIMFIFLIPLQTWLVKRDRVKNGGRIRPESRFLLSLFLVWGFPISIFWFAWTSAPHLGHTTYWSPVCAGTMLGAIAPLVFLGILNYVADSYPNLAGSAIAASLIPSFVAGAACAHLGIWMFQRLTTQVVVSILGGVSVGAVILIYTVYFFGPALRARSRYARKF